MGTAPAPCLQGAGIFISCYIWYVKQEKMFKFQIIKSDRESLARTGEITTSHGKIQTPVFMPCATVGAVRGISPQELKELGFELILANTFHLYLRPGEETVKKFGGLHQFMNWDKTILTDSGGYQVFSLGAGNRSKERTRLVKIEDQGVIFRSHLDGSRHQFSPAKVLEIQKSLGADILMVLDDCTPYPVSHQEAEESMARTHLWAQKSIEIWQKNKNSGQALFGIVQGSVYRDLRLKSAEFISNLPFDGVAVGGVSVGEEKSKMYEVIKWVGPRLPKDKPHYLMGVGEPQDLIFAAKYGFDMFDCVLPTRLGRHGTVWVTQNFKKFTKINLRKTSFASSKEPIMKGCPCPACHKGYSRGYLSHLIREKEMLGMRLATLHNLSIIQQLLKKIREKV